MIKRPAKALVLLSLVITGTLCLQACLQAQDLNDRSISYDFPASGHIRMNLSPGEYSIEGSADEKIHIVWRPHRLEDAGKFRASFTRHGGSGELRTRNSTRGNVLVRVPARSGLKIMLSAGELKIDGIEGHKDVSMSAGELHIDVGDPAQYGKVESSVRIGEIAARPFGEERSGFFRSVKVKGQGSYLLRAKLGVGEIRLSNRETASD